MYSIVVFSSEVRTSAAAAAAALGSFPALLPPTACAGPPTFGFDFEAALPSFVTRAGSEAVVAGAGAEAKVRPLPWKLSSFDGFPQRLPMDVVA